MKTAHFTVALKMPTERELEPELIERLRDMVYKSLDNQIHGFNDLLQEEEGFTVEFIDVEAAE